MALKDMKGLAVVAGIGLIAYYFLNGKEPGKPVLLPKPIPIPIPKPIPKVPPIDGQPLNCPAGYMLWIEGGIAYCVPEDTWITPA